MGRMGKTIRVSESTHERLNDLKPYDSMTFDELIEEMAEVYENARGEQRIAADA
jgi:predicted CopG family antitoxin